MAEKAGPTEPIAQALRELVARAVARLGVRAEDRDDVVQESTMKLLNAWDEDNARGARGRGEAAWTAYITTTAKRTFLDIQRSRQRRLTRERRSVLGTDGEPLLDRPGVHRAPPNDPRTNGDLDRLLARWLVAELIDKHLDGRRREVARLIFSDGLSIREVAAELRIAERTARQHRQAAIVALQRAVAFEQRD